MKNKLFSIFTALAMVLGILVAPFTSAKAVDQKEPAQITVNVHKIVMDKAALDAHNSNKKYDPVEGIKNLKDFFGENSNAQPINNVYFVAIKEGENGYADFDTKTRTEQEAIINGLADGRKGLTANVKGEDGIKQFKLDNPGKYKIYEVKFKSTYKGAKGEVLTDTKAIPVDLILPDHARNEKGVQKEIHVYPKNAEKKVTFDKNFLKGNTLAEITDNEQLKAVGAVAENYAKEKANVKGEIGKEIPYEALANLPKGSVFTNLDLADTMDKGLKYKAEDGVTIEVTPALDKALDKGTDYKITSDKGNGFELKFEQSGLDKLNEVAKKSDVSIKFTYKAKVTADAVNDQPMDNNITLSYNHTPKTPTSEKVTPKDKTIKVSKTWVDGQVPTGVKVKYQLLDENEKPVADVTFKAAKEVDRKDLGNGITFDVTGDFAGTFKGLKETGYKIKEIVDGYEPEYVINNGEGSVEVKNTKEPNSITPTPPQVTVGGRKFVKTGTEATTKLAGAEFVIQNKNDADNVNKNKYLKINGTGNEDAYIKAEKAYNDAIQAVNDALKKGEISEKNPVTIEGVAEAYKEKSKAMAKVKELENKRNEEFVKASLTYTWVGTTDEATKFNSNEKGQFEVTGLAYGDYQAVETKAPAGYALPTSGGTFTFKVKAGSYAGETSDLDYTKADDSADGKGQQIINNKVTIPQTGGIGSLIFVVAGIAIMGFAFVAYKRSEARA